MINWAITEKVLKLPKLYIAVPQTIKEKVFISFECCCTVRNII